MVTLFRSSAMLMFGCACTWLSSEFAKSLCATWVCMIRSSTFCLAWRGASALDVMLAPLMRSPARQDPGSRFLVVILGSSDI